MIKAQISGRIASIGISDADHLSILGENPSEEVYDDFIIMIMNKLQETTVFHGRQKLTSAMKLRLEK